MTNENKVPAATWPGQSSYDPPRTGQEPAAFLAMPVNLSPDEIRAMVRDVMG